MYPILLYYYIIYKYLIYLINTTLHYNTLFIILYLFTNTIVFLVIAGKYSMNESFYAY